MWLFYGQICGPTICDQSDGNSFWGDVVLDSFNMVKRHEGSILDQKYEKEIFIMKILYF